MTRRVPYLLKRSNRYYARVVIPQRLRPFLNGKTELRTSLGADYKQALDKLYAAVAAIKSQLSQAELMLKDTPPPAEHAVPSPSHPLTHQQMAARLYHLRLEQDLDARNAHHSYASVGIDDGLVSNLRQGIAGSLSDADLERLVGRQISYFASRGHTAAAIGSTEWRALARQMCKAELETLERVYERDTGDFSGHPKETYYEAGEPELEQTTVKVTITQIFEDYMESRRTLGRGAAAHKRWRPVIRSLQSFLGHDDADALSSSDLRKWRDHLLTSLNPKTVSDVYLACIRGMLAWAVDNEIVEKNVAKGVKQELPRRITTREKGYTRTEATRILSVATSKTYSSGSYQACRWIPLLCAFSGARVGEIAQLRKQDFRDESGILVMRITSDAGTVKSGLYRDVPIHPQILTLGFQKYLSNAKGALFWDSSSRPDPLKASHALASTVRRMLEKHNLTVKGVAPNHGWRHCFKTTGREMEIQDRILDAIVGHAAKTAGDSYGDVTIKTKHAAILKLPTYELARPAAYR